MTEPKANIFNPFPGLRPFNEEEDYLFFGREQQVAELVTLLRNQRFIAVTGTSGSGKSSLVRAGLLPELQGGMMKEVGSDWETLVLRPGGAPLQHLAEAVAEASLEDPEDPKVIGELLATLNHSGLGLVEAIRQSDIEPGTNVLILVDQFEEIFRFQRSGAANQEQAVGFVNLLLEAGAQRDLPIFVIITMRSDYLGDCTEFRGLTEAVNEGEYLIPRLTRDQIRSCIEGPIKVGGGDISFALVQELLNSLGGEQDQLPVLQHALMRSFDYWQSQDSGGDELELSHYQSVGGMETALSRHADEVFDQLNDEQQLVAKSVFKAITERGVDNRGIRRPTRLDLLTEIADADLSQVISVVEAFRHPGVTFLMPPSEVPLTPETVVDISHESLMRVWLRLKDWVDDEAQSARIYRRLTETAELHQQGNAGLYRDPDLQIALAWRDSESPTSKWATRYSAGFDQAMTFLQSSEESALAAEREREIARQRELEQAQALAAAEAERAESQQRAAKRLRILSTGVAAVAAVALIAFLFALSAQRESTRQRGIAEESAAVAESAKANAEQNAKSALEAQGIAEKSQQQAEDAAVQLNNTLTRSQFVTGHEQLASENKDLALAYFARSLRTKPSYWQSAAQIVSLLSNNNFPIGETKTLEQEQPFRYHGVDKSKRFIWSLTDEQVGALWVASSGEKVATLNGGNRVNWPYFTDSGDHLFVTLPDQGGSIVGMSTETGDPVTPVMAVSNRSSKPYWLLSRVPGEIRVFLDNVETRQPMLWDGKTGEVIDLEGDSQTPLSQPNPVNDNTIAPSPDHRHVFAAFADQTISVWRASDGKAVVQNLKHGIGLDKCGMSPDSRWLFASSVVEQTLKWADLSEALNESATPPTFQTKTFEFPIRTVAFHPEKPLLLIAGRTIAEGMIRILNLETGEFVCQITEDKFGAQSQQSMAGMRFLGLNEEEKILERWIIGIASHKGRQIRVCDLESGEEIHRFDFDDSLVRVADFTPDGSRLITSHDDRTLRIWNVFNGVQVTRPIKHPFRPSFEITPDGQKVVTFNAADLSMRVYSTRTGEQLMLPLSTTSNAFASSFTQLKDRTQFVSAEMVDVVAQNTSYLDKGLLYRWSAQPRQARRLDKKFSVAVYGVSFSPDGTQVVAGSGGDGTKAKVWTAATGKVLKAFRHDGGINSSIFNPSGDRVVTASSDGVVRIWDLDATEPLEFEILAGGKPDFIEFDQSGKRLLITTEEGSVGVWDAESGFPLFEPLTISGRANFSIDGKHVVYGGLDGILRLIDSDTGKISQVGERTNTGITLSPSPDGVHVGYTSFGDFLRVVNLETGDIEWKAPSRQSNLATAFHPNGDIIAVCNALSYDWLIGKIDLWNWRTGERPVEALDCEGQVYPGCLEFSPNGHFVAAGTLNGRLKVWEVSTGKPLFSEQFPERIWKVSFSADSKKLLTCRGDDGSGAVTLYDLPPVNDPVPDWLPELAERVAKKRINEVGGVEAVSEGLADLKAKVESSDAQDGYTRWAKWFFADPLQRPIHPTSNITTREYVEIKSRGVSQFEQNEAFLLDPNNGLISCRTGYLRAVSTVRAGLSPQARTQWDECAMWYCDQGTELAPNNGEAWALKAAVEQVLGRSAANSIAKALQLDPESPIALYVNAHELHQQGDTEGAYKAFTKSIGALPPTRHRLDWENDKPFMVGTLRTLLLGEELGPFALSQVGVQRLFQTGDTVERRSLEADWLTRYACDLSPDDVRVWRFRAQFLASAEREEEFQEAIAKSLQRLEDGSIDWRQYGDVVNERCAELIKQKRFTEAHQYVLRFGIPPRADEATQAQVDLSSMYNQALVQMPYRTRTDSNNDTYTWKRLPLGLLSADEVLFDVRGYVRLRGGFIANREFADPVPSKVADIPVNQKAKYLHFLHNIVANVQNRIPNGEIVGYYILHYADDEEVRLPIRYGQDVIPWVYTRHVKPTRARVGWSEGLYQNHKTLSHSVWENPRPDVEISSIDFESTNTHSAPFLISVSLEPDSFAPEEEDADLMSAEAFRRSFLVQGQTAHTRDAVDALSKQALELAPDDANVAYRRAEVLYQTDQLDQALALIETLCKENPESTVYRLLEGRVLWKLGRVEEAAIKLQRREGEQPFNQSLDADQQLIWDQFAEEVTEKMGIFEGRNWLYRLHIPPRENDLPIYLVDLSKHYNASLEESWYTPQGYPNYSGPILNQIRHGVHVLDGTSYDIRGLIQLNDPTAIDIYYPFPQQVNDIVVGVEGNQIHFLHASLSDDRPGTPVAIYQIHLSNGDVHDHIVRFGLDINEMTRNHDAPRPECTVWISPNSTPFSDESDALLHQSTWNNPTPEHSIDHVDLKIADARAQPFLVAMTVESFDQQLSREPSDIVQVAEIALRKLKQDYSTNQSVFDHLKKVAEKIESEGSDNPRAMYLLAKIYSRFDESERALELVGQAMELAGANKAECLTLKSEILGTMQEFPLARATQREIRRAFLDDAIAKRGEDLNSRFVDLGDYYNVTLEEFPYQTEQSTRTLTETFEQIKPGLSEFAGTPFDVRGIIALSGSETELSAGIYELNRDVYGIPIGRKASAINLLHGAGWGGSEPHGTCIGEVVVNYEDGQTEIVEIKAGVHVRDWFLPRYYGREVTDGKLAWVHPSKQVNGRDIGVYSMSWENPRPEAKIRTIDFRSTMTKGAPFLLGVTLEE